MIDAQTIIDRQQLVIDLLIGWLAAAHGEIDRLTHEQAIDHGRFLPDEVERFLRERREREET